MTSTEWLNTVKKEAKVPQWMIDQLWTKADIDLLIESESDDEYNENLEYLITDIDLYIEYLNRLKKFMPQMAKGGE